MLKHRLIQIPVHRTSKGDHYLDPVRKQLVPATREEQVRQSVIVSLMQDYGYPLAALQSEEPVARGTKDRRRADVIIRLPSRVHSGLRIVEGNEAKERAQRYSEKVRRLGEEWKPGKWVTLVSVPDEVAVAIAGRQVNCRTLGFVRLHHGFGLGLEPPRHTVEELDLPPVIGLQVNGHGLTSFEKGLAAKLGIPKCEWTFDATFDFIDQLVGVDQDPATRLQLESTALSADGTSGGTISFVDDENFGVLVWFDISQFEAPDDGPSELERVPPSVRPAKPPDNNDGWRPMAVVECKAPGIPLTEEVKQQGRGYAKRLQAKVLSITNGEHSQTFDVDGNRALDDLPTYKTVVAGDGEVTALRELPPSPKLTATAAERPDVVHLHRRYRDNLGRETPEALSAILIALDDAFRLVTKYEGFTRSRLKFVEDLGVNYHAPGSPTGAGWPGDYRDFLVEDESSDRIVIGVGLQSAWSVVIRDMLGKSVIAPGKWTYLLLAASEGPEYESVAQIALDKSLTKTSTGWLLTHDGKMTAGKGAVSPKRVIEAVAEEAPELVRSGRIVLAEVPDQIPLEIETTRTLLGNLAKYVMVRRRLKVEVKKERKRRRR